MWPKRKPTWQQLHPLPPGWRPRTRIDPSGREVEPWGYVISAGGFVYDGGEWWLPVGYDPDQAAWTILERWLPEGGPVMTAVGLSAAERAGVRCYARPNAYAGNRVGVAYAAGQALTG